MSHEPQSQLALDLVEKLTYELVRRRMLSADALARILAPCDTDAPGTANIRASMLNRLRPAVPSVLERADHDGEPDTPD